MRLFLRAFFPPFIVVVVIFVATCLLSPEDIPEMSNDIPWDKFVHFGMFFTLSVVSMYSFYICYNKHPPLLRCLLYAFFIPVLYGGIIELLQKYVFKYRSGDWTDFWADICGSLVGIVLAYLFLKKMTARKKND